MSDAHEDLGYSQARVVAAVFACGHPQPQGIKPPAGRLCRSCEAIEDSARSEQKASVRRALKQNPPRDSIDTEDAMRQLVDCGHTIGDAKTFLAEITKGTRSTRGKSKGTR